MTIKIITDGTSDLPKELAQELDITVVPLLVRFGDKEMTSDMSNSLFYEMMRSEPKLPQTASPSPHTFMEEYSKADGDILVVCVSSNLSSTYHHATMAKEQMIEEGYTGKIEVLDSRSASLGQGILAVKAAKLAQEGVPFEELVVQMQNTIKNHHTYFFLDTLENVIKGGRLDRVRGAVASVLNIKLLMKASEEGTLEPFEKVRGTQNALKRLLERVGEKVSETRSDFEKIILGIAHSNCEERARDVKEQMLKLFPFGTVVISEMGPVIGTYAGEGGILITC
ncbi:DegV family protein [Paenibacillus sp. FJAT-26967]|uniref:DegV family protein n=1 Tax=Paenibacillus sp. FJAT-26967 TaxID=1729690 RepID=UPI000837DF63|nr:DegV family protein [Paenibacillus sp. FJAT-26967]